MCTHVRRRPFVSCTTHHVSSQMQSPHARLSAARLRYVLKLSKPDSPKLLLLIESGVRFHLTQYARDKGDIPSGFTMKLRKHLKSKRIEEISQVASDRVVVFACGSGEAR